MLLVAGPGCSWAPSAPAHFLSGSTDPAAVANPMFVPVIDREFLWNQIVDTIDNDFRIEREQRMRVIGDVVTQGQIDTYPTIGATALEPWRTDSTPGFGRMYATLQSVRRRATLWVNAAERGYLVQVQVITELEDVNRPEHATVGAAIFRDDGSLTSDTEGKHTGPVTLGWIPVGRDMALEQKILQEIAARVADNASLERLPQTL